MRPTIRETVIKQVELDNLDYQVEFDFFGKHPNDDCWDYDWVHDYDNSNHSSYWKSNEHVPVDMLLEAVEKLKAEGATHIQIHPHGDHESYYLTGVKLELIPEKEVIERNKKKLETAISNHKIRMKLDEQDLAKSVDFLAELYEELEKLNGELEQHFN